jgi:hypothetical protein
VCGLHGYEFSSASAMASFTLSAPTTSRCRQAAPVRRSGVCRASSVPPAVTEAVSSRRCVAATLLAMPALLAARPAFALLPDDEDEECVHASPLDGTLQHSAVSTHASRWDALLDADAMTHVPRRH